MVPMLMLVRTKILYFREEEEELFLIISLKSGNNQIKLKMNLS
jgi:hypothetical protein